MTVSAAPPAFSELDLVSMFAEGFPDVVRDLRVAEVEEGEGGEAVEY